MHLKLFIYILLFLAPNLASHGQKIKLIINSTTHQEDSLLKSISPSLVYNNLSDLNKSIETTRDSLYKLGYFNLEFKTLRKISESLFSTSFRSGNKTKLIRIYYEDDKVNFYLNKNEDNPYFDIIPEEIPKTLRQFSKLETDSGFPLTSFSLENIIYSENLTTADLKVIRENKRRLTKIEVKGYEKFPKSFFKYYARLDTTKVFSKKIILSKTNALDELLFINQIKKPEILFTKDSTNLFIYIDKNTANRFEGFLGFGTKERDNKLRLDGYLDLNLENNFNYGESINLSYKGNGDNQQTLNIGIRLPFLLKSPISTSASLNLFRQDSTFSTSSQRLEFDYTFNSKLQLFSSLAFQSSNTLSDNLNLLVEDFQKTSYSAGVLYNGNKKKKLLSNPTFLRLEIGYSKRTLENSNASGDQLYSKLTAEHTFNLSRGHQFNIKTKNILLNSENYLSNELFRFGGMNSLRGFKENSLIANFYSTLQTEYRYIANPNLYINTIIDTAYFENKITNQQELLYSLGLGAAILTKAGLLKINLANGIQGQQTFRFSNSILHLTLVTGF